MEENHKLKSPCNGPLQQQTNNQINQKDNYAKNDIQISKATKEKVEALKQYIEKKYQKLKEEEQLKKEGWENLKNEMHKMNLTPAEQQLVQKEILHREAILNREHRTKISIKDFIPVTVIGKGAFGEVRLVRNKRTNEILAMKKMKKK